jgi:hypothetical protein
VPQVTCGSIEAASRRTSASKVAPVVGGQGAPVADGVLPGGGLGRHRAALEVGEGGLVGGDQAGAAPGLDRHVADRHAALHREAADDGARVLDGVAGAAAGADLADDGEDHVLRGAADGQVAVDADPHGLGALLHQRLGRQDVLDLDVPMPKASAPKAPWVLVWLSPQTIVVPGRVKPCSGR